MQPWQIMNEFDCHNYVFDYIMTHMLSILLIAYLLFLHNEKEIIVIIVWYNGNIIS